MCRRGVRCISREPVWGCGPSRANPEMSGVGERRARFGAILCLAAQALQENQVMPDRPAHGGMLPIGNAILFGRLLHNPGQRTIVSVAHKRAQMMDNMMVQPARKPSYERVTRRIISRRREDVIDAAVELAAVRGKVSAVDRVCRLEHERDRQADDYM